MRVFCFPFAGGNAATFHGWSAFFPEAAQICPIHLPGRPPRFHERPITDSRLLVTALAAALQNLDSTPFVFFGHSMGALIAYETAHRLRQGQGPLPAALFVCASRAPQLPRRDSPIHHLPDADFVDRVRDLGGMDSRVLENPELMELCLPALRADFTMVETYALDRARPPLNLPILAIGGTRDSFVCEDEVAGWREQTTGAFALHMMEGDHFCLNADRGETVCRILDSYIDKYLRPNPPSRGID
jgi:medium-chain acyl-[acyl-carrier-protein] hydrolase